MVDPNCQTGEARSTNRERGNTMWEIESVAGGYMSTKKRVVVLQSVKKPAADTNISEKLRDSVENSGNLVFQAAILSQIKADSVISDWTSIPDDTGTIILTLANFVRPDITGLANEAEILSKSKADTILLVGIGAQSYDYDENLQIAPAARRILDIASERSKSIGVRGFYTAELLNKNGIKNIEVIGCPSMFYHLTSDFCPSRIAAAGRNQAKPLVDPSAQARERSTEQATAGEADNDRDLRSPRVPRISINATPTGYFRDKISELFSFGIRHSADYVLQNERHILPLLRNDELTQAEEDAVNFFTNYYRSKSHTPKSIREWLRTHGLIFFDVDEWIAYSKSRDLVMGCRFHGNITALLSGTPTVTLHFDTRTREMAEYLTLPNLPLCLFDETKSPEYYIEMGNYEAFEAAFPEKYRKYWQFLENNGVPHLLDAPSATDSSSIRNAIGELPRCLSLSDRVKFLSTLELLNGLRGEADTRIPHELLVRMWTERSQSEREDVERAQPTLE